MSVLWHAMWHDALLLPRHHELGGTCALNLSMFFCDVDCVHLLATVAQGSIASIGINLVRSVALGDAKVMLFSDHSGHFWDLCAGCSAVLQAR